jgi:YD repeat-containing protein
VRGVRSIAPGKTNYWELATQPALNALYHLTSKTDRKNQTIQYVYDSLYRLSTKTYPDQTDATYIYDLVGKIKQVSDPTGTYGFAYDNMGRLIGTTTQYSFLPGHNFQNGGWPSFSSTPLYSGCPILRALCEGWEAR